MAKQRTRKKTKPEPPARKTPRQRASPTPSASVVRAPEWEGQPCCPLCGKPDSAQCEHLMSAWDPSEDYGYWGLGGGPDELRPVVKEIYVAIRAAFTDEQLELVSTLRRLPPELLPPLNESFDGWFALGGWLEYLNNQLEQSPTFAGTSHGETCGCGSSSSWTCYWDRDPGKAAKVVGRKLDKNLRALHQIAKMANRLPAVDQE